MISADALGFDALSSRLAAKARAIAEARFARIALARSKDARRWRRAGLLWPLFARR